MSLLKTKMNGFAKVVGCTLRFVFLPSVMQRRRCFEHLVRRSSAHCAKKVSCRGEDHKAMLCRPAASRLIVATSTILPQRNLNLQVSCSILTSLSATEVHENNRKFTHCLRSASRLVFYTSSSLLLALLQTLKIDLIHRQ